MTVPPPQPPQTPRDARAQAKSERAYRKASRPWILRHWLLSSIAVVIVIIIIAVAASGGSSNSNNNTAGGNNNETGGKVLQHSEDIKITKCAKSGGVLGGDYDAKVKITNHSSKPSDYVVTIAFESTNGKKQLATGDAIVDSLQPGQSSTQDADGLKSAKVAFKCVLSDAQRTESTL